MNTATVIAEINKTIGGNTSSEYYRIANNASNFEQFVSADEKNAAVANFFAEIEHPNGIKSNVLGYIYNEDGDNIGYYEEHYTDSGSNDYYYTATFRSDLAHAIANSL